MVKEIWLCIRFLPSRLIFRKEITMAQITDAVSQAARVGEIGFADFTAQLVRDVFKAILETNIEQTNVYIELVERVAQGLAAYINTTRDDISAEEIAQFIALLSDTIRLEAGQSLTQEQADAINAATTRGEGEGESGGTAVAAAGALDAAAVTRIRDAIATRIATNRFTLLETMVRQGITRLVIDHGVIESRLTFSTYSRASSVQSQRSTQRLGLASGGIGIGGVGALAPNAILGAAGIGGVGAFALRTRTASTLDRDVSGSSVQIYGRVSINFKTDYVPLAT